MARARNIKPGFFLNEELVELPFATRLLFIGLWTLADREGRMEDKPKRIKMALFPADNLDIDAALNELHQSSFVLRYEHDGERYIQVLAFDKHQNPHRDEKPSTIPAPCEHGASTVQAPCEHGGYPADSLLLIPDSLPLIKETKTPPVPVESASPKYSPIADLLENRVSQQTAADWLAVRKAKKAAPTQTAIQGVLREIGKAGLSPEDGLKMCCERGWAGFSPDWLANSNTRAGPAKPEKFDPLAYVNRNRMETKPDERTIEFNELGEPV